MSIVIKVENLSKKYVINHENKERYSTLRDVLTDLAKKYGSRILHPFKTNINQYQTKEEFWALKDVSFEVKQGERIGIIGCNGAGKSTLLKLLSRITEPTSGSIKLKGRVSSLLEVGTGFHPELTGRENVYLNGTILGMSRNEINKKFDAIVSFSEVEKFIDTPVKRYSSGMQVRLAFAVAAHLEPEILLVDEVLAVGDSAFQKKCLGKMEEYGDKNGKTVIFVSHNLNAIAKLCPKCLLLDNGCLKDFGQTRLIIQDYLSLQTVVNKGKIDLTSPALRKNSLVNSRFKWKEVKILNSKNEITSRIALNEPFSFMISAELISEVKDVRCGFGIMSPMGFPLFNSFYEDSNKKSLNLDKGIVTFVYEMKNNLLLPGNYEVDLGAIGTGVVDWLPVAFSFTVEEFSKDQKEALRPDFGGVIMPQGVWATINY